MAIRISLKICYQKFVGPFVKKRNFVEQMSGRSLNVIAWMTVLAS